MPISPEVDLPGSDVRKPNVSVFLSRTVYEQQYVRTLFDAIAHRYDFLNHFLSSGFDILWRKKVVKLMQPYRPGVILDLATGTADLAIEEARLPVERIFGVDISRTMLSIGAEKVRKRDLQQIITLEEGEAESLRFDDCSIDAVSVAFGVRNFRDLTLGLSEMLRVLRPGGVAFILEFSQPRLFPFKQLYYWYLQRILPLLGGFISRNREAYQYLHNTVREFPDGEKFLSILQGVGFKNCRNTPFTLGIVTIYEAHK